MSGMSEEGLVQHSTALVAGLEAIVQRYQEHVIFAWEDPVTFGGGHFVLYPESGSMTRFAIEEKYTGTDWSDDDRVATSWTWDSQARVRQPTGDYPWVSLAHGEVTPGDYQRLLGLAESWAKTTYDHAEREQALTADPVTATGIDRMGGPRTLLT
ncbi:hypothetical protein [Leucobacter sp. M11]|uniref:hypothetical protein n=1 Tax=Leucobacter sp. M11 TaxID=2993565 RepID=UPI002D800A4E|nr:hypothetical protein [Leucobacter sp. M11]MEB4613779.1 hypothetical protein [Leucobacter sp. M11]